MAKPNKDRTAAPSSSRCVATSSAPSDAARSSIISACVVVGLVIIGLAAVPADQAEQASPATWPTSARAAARAGCQDVVKKKADRQPGPQAESARTIAYADAPAGVRPALPEPGGVRAQVLHRRRPPAASSTSCTTWSTATTCSGTTTRSPRTPTSSPSSRRIAAKFEGTEAHRQVHRAAVDRARTARRSPSGTHVALTHWSAGGDPSSTSRSSRASGSTARRPAARPSQTFMKDYPYTDSPEPQRACEPSGARRRGPPRAARGRRSSRALVPLINIEAYLGVRGSVGRRRQHLAARLRRRARPDGRQGRLVLPRRQLAELGLGAQRKVESPKAQARLETLARPARTSGPVHRRRAGVRLRVQRLPAVRDPRRCSPASCG